jgi:hypothetical protein
MRNRQRGVTFLGWVFLLAPMALVVYAAIRLTPVYLEYMKIARTLEQVSEEFKGEAVEAQSIRLAVERRFDIESVTAINVRDAESLIIAKEGSGYKVEAVYAEAVPFISNVSLLVEFDKVVQIE